MTKTGIENRCSTDVRRCSSSTFWLGSTSTFRFTYISCCSNQYQWWSRSSLHRVDEVMVDAIINITMAFTLHWFTIWRDFGRWEMPERFASLVVLAFQLLVLSSFFLLFYFFVFLTVGLIVISFPIVPDFVFYSLLHLTNTYHFTNYQQYFANYFSIFEIAIIIGQVLAINWFITRLLQPITWQFIRPSICII